MSQENGEFTVKDRRIFDESGDLRADEQKAEEAARPQAEPKADPGGAKSGQFSQGKASSSAPPLPPDFASFIVSLSHAALFHLGQVPDPQSGQTSRDLPMARHTIDTIAMLKEKTRGNLDSQEQQLIDNVLTDLRLVFVRTSKGA